MVNVYAIRSWLQYCDCVGHRQPINVLLLADTGVGKSTLINSFANNLHLHFKSREEAVQKEGLFSITRAFPFFPVTYRQTGRLINISSECNGTTLTSKAAEVGESVTQNPGEYVFQHKETLITLIDTAGLKDTNDTPNHEIDRQHAICILLMADESRLTKTFILQMSIYWEFPWVPWVPWNPHKNGNHQTSFMRMGMGMA